VRYNANSLPLVLLLRSLPMQHFPNLLSSGMGLLVIFRLVFEKPPFWCNRTIDGKPRKVFLDLLSSDSTESFLFFVTPFYLM
jgi:hypothetical protein